MESTTFCTVAHIKSWACGCYSQLRHASLKSAARFTKGSGGNSGGDWLGKLEGKVRSYFSLHHHIECPGARHGGLGVEEIWL